jgi:trigger factor
VVGYPDIEEVQFERGQALHFTATVETAPEFQLPDYKGIPAQLEAKTVTDADVDPRAGNAARPACEIRNGRAAELAGGDIAVVNYTGTCDGKPITELAPTAKGLTEQKNFWVETKPRVHVHSRFRRAADRRASRRQADRERWIFPPIS